VFQRPLQCDQVSVLALPPRLQSLLTMKKLWAEYSALLVRTKIAISTTAVDQLKGARSSNGQSQQSDINVRIHNLGARWSAEARAIQFDFEFKALEQERRRVAKDLHDEILPLLARLLRSIPSGHDSDCSLLVDEVHAAVAAFRDLLGELHPVDLEELGLIPAIDNICKRYVRNSGRFILFFEQSDHCNLSLLQQLSVYRAVQSVLKMFVESKNDILMVNYNRVENGSVITVKCADKLVSSAEWVTAEKAEFNAFESWCALAGAKVEFGADDEGTQFPSDLVITIAEEPNLVDELLSAPTERAPTLPTKPSTHSSISPLDDDLSQARLVELNTILNYAKQEWARLSTKDRTLFESLAVGAERKKISEEIDRAILPRLERIVYLADQFGDLEIKHDVNNRMNVIASCLNAIMSELHPQLLAEAGLISSIQALVDRFRRASLIETSISSTLLSDQIDISHISPEAKFAIYRVTQEALNSVEKHSGATHALVTVAQMSDRLIISIEDNGKGFSGAANTLSRGLKNIRERASGIGAEVSWKNSLSFATGTVVTISLSCFTPAQS
jgi:signal transduction histidine kinase